MSEHVHYTHMRVDVAGAIRNRAFSGWLDDQGREVSRDAVEAHLRDLLAKGTRYVPLGPCDRFDPEQGCLGHEEAAGE